jgi:hypothetical protein
LTDVGRVGGAAVEAVWFNLLRADLKNAAGEKEMAKPITWKRIRRWARDNNTVVLPVSIGALVVILVVTGLSLISGMHG